MEETGGQAAQLTGLTKDALQVGRGEVQGLRGRVELGGAYGRVV
jgi:hypothetical protein